MNVECLDEHPRWYAIRTRPQQEDRADLNLRGWQVQTFSPKLKERRTTGYVDRYVSKPLFNRYIFAHFDASRLLHKVNYTRGVQNVVSFGNRPVAVDDKVIALIKDQVDEDGFIRIGEELKFGDKVMIKSGPFKSFVGIFQSKIKKTDRVKMLLETVSYQSHLLIDREMMEKAKLGLKNKDVGRIEGRYSPGSKKRKC
jgi:transcriptional antiterminator RfaH